MANNAIDPRLQYRQHAAPPPYSVEDIRHQTPHLQSHTQSHSQSHAHGTPLYQLQAVNHPQSLGEAHAVDPNLHDEEDESDQDSEQASPDDANANG